MMIYQGMGWQIVHRGDQTKAKAKGKGKGNASVACICAGAGGEGAGGGMREWRRAGACSHSVSSIGMQQLLACYFQNQIPDTQIQIPGIQTFIFGNQIVRIRFQILKLADFHISNCQIQISDSDICRLS